MAAVRQMHVVEPTATLERREEAARESSHPDAYQVDSFDFRLEPADGVMKLHRRPVEAGVCRGFHWVLFHAHVRSDILNVLWCALSLVLRQREIEAHDT